MFSFLYERSKLEEDLKKISEDINKTEYQKIIEPYEKEIKNLHEKLLNHGKIIHNLVDVIRYIEADIDKTHMEYTFLIDEPILCEYMPSEKAMSHKIEVAKIPISRNAIDKINIAMQEAFEEGMLDKRKLQLEEKCKELRHSMAKISEICVDESKCHITSKESLDYYRNNIYECPIDILRILYGELLQEIKHLEKERDSIYADYQELGKEKLQLEEKVDEYTKQLDLDYVDKNFVSKDKIRKKIKQLNTEGKIKIKKLGGTDRCLTKLEYMHKENVLQELLNED